MFEVTIRKLLLFRWNKCFRPDIFLAIIVGLSKFLVMKTICESTVGVLEWNISWLDFAVPVQSLSKRTIIWPLLANVPINMPERILIRDDVQVRRNPSSKTMIQVSAGVLDSSCFFFWIVCRYAYMCSVCALSNPLWRSAPEFLFHSKGIMRITWNGL